MQLPPQAFEPELVALMGRAVCVGQKDPERLKAIALETLDA